MDEDPLTYQQYFPLVIEIYCGDQLKQSLAMLMAQR